MKAINVLSLFDGMSCMQIALKELNIPVSNYFASEVDKHAIAQTQLNFPDTVQLGDVRSVDVSKLPYIHVLAGGSPCQSFSFAGKRNGMTTKENVEIYTLEHYLQLKDDDFEFDGQSYLFWEYMRILKDVQAYNPGVLFLLENVEMGAKWERVLSEAIGIYGVHINSALVSAQNRKRIYWTNFRTKRVGLFGEMHSDIPQPADRGILLKDILESEVDEKYYLSDKMISYLTNHSDKKQSEGCGFKFNPSDGDKKASTVTQRSHKMGVDDNYVCVSMVGRKTDENGTRKDNNPNLKAQQRLEPNLNGKTNCLTSVQKDNLGMCLTPKRTEYGKAIRKDYEAGKVDAQRKEVCQLEPREDGKTNTLTTVQKDNLVMQINPSIESGGKQPYQQNRVYDSDGISPALCANKADLMIRQKPRGFNKGADYTEKSPTLSSNSWEQNNILHQNYRIRRLTPTECARLQTIPDWYKWACSDTQAYRMLGNGWTIEVIKHILTFADFNNITQCE